MNHKNNPALLRAAEEARTKVPSMRPPYSRSVEVQLDVEVTVIDASQQERLDQAFDDAIDLMASAAELVAAIEGRRRDLSAKIGDLPGIAHRCARLSSGLEQLVDAETEAAASCHVKSA